MQSLGCDSLSTGLASHSLVVFLYKLQGDKWVKLVQHQCGLCHCLAVGNMSLSDGACAFSHCSQMVATCGYEDIRVWSLNDHRELLRISVPNMTCHAVTITVDGKSIISGQ